MDDEPHVYDISVSGLPEMEMSVDFKDVRAPAGKVLSVPVRVQAEEHNLTERSSTIEFTIKAQDDETLNMTEKARFLGPIQ